MDFNYYFYNLLKEYSNNFSGRQLNGKAHNSNMVYDIYIGFMGSYWNYNNNFI